MGITRGSLDVKVVPPIKNRGHLMLSRKHSYLFKVTPDFFRIVGLPGRWATVTGMHVGSKEKSEPRHG
jgi:hypothetical protein